MFNIITPTYNREKLIHRVYDSLNSQTYKKFKWIVIDDASLDNTKSLIENWKSVTRDFEIEYYCLTENMGKPKAVNFGLTKCTFPYTIIADSDDTFSENALEVIMDLWNHITNDKIAAIWTLVLDEDDKIKGDKFPKDKWQVGFKERVLNQKQQLVGDKWTIWKTDVLKAHPLYSDTKSHIEESQTWNAINKKYDFLCVNKSFLKAHISPNSLITSKKSRKQLSRGGYYSAYYALHNVKTSDIIKYSYYRNQAFNYVKSWLFYSDKKLKLSFSKRFVSIIIFLFKTPQRLIKRLK
ncbi:glycosyltransferase family 2 protein [uncultured Psychroserpens sp.]|uniref:glycosyltransferase family 2 protein n=1 Tax=uncultured Psychroserpens sp. TaxID=255436 RepID=UPI002638D47E|nr:glycosyltransferase family 2 protein [uncultured Psychroserpens sp.]